MRPLPATDASPLRAVFVVLLITALGCHDATRPVAVPDASIREPSRSLLPGVELPLVSRPAAQVWPDVSGDKVVWVDTRDGNEEIYLMDLGTGAERNLTQDPGSQTEPAIDGRYVVWTDRSGGDMDLYAYDLLTSTRLPVAVRPGDQSGASISGTRVVWHEHRFDSYDIFMFDLVTGIETRLTSDADEEMYPDISGDRVVWDQSDVPGSGASNIVVLDLVTGVRRQLTSGPGLKYQARISGDYVAWNDERAAAGSPNVYLYDLATDTERQVTSTFSINTRISGHHLIYRTPLEPVKIEAYDIEDATYQPITTTDATNPNIDGDRIVWARFVGGDYDIYYFGPPPAPNLAPVVTGTSSAATPFPVGASVQASATFTDENVVDTHTATLDWGDGTSATAPVTESAGSGTVTAAHSYTAPGVYTLTFTVTDNRGLSGTGVYQFVVVYDPTGGFVTGGGAIVSPSGACMLSQCAGATGLATFGFVAKYLPGATTPSGSTEFQFHAGGLRFRSTSYEWLVVGGSRAQFKGLGTVNGAGSYGFLLTAVDGALDGGTADRFRLKVWDRASDLVVYDNALGDESGATMLAQGNIAIKTR